MAQPVCRTMAPGRGVNAFGAKAREPGAVMRRAAKGSGSEGLMTTANGFGAGPGNRVASLELMQGLSPANVYMDGTPDSTTRAAERELGERRERQAQHEAARRDGVTSPKAFRGGTDRLMSMSPMIA